jgi:hypothetical protein
MAKKSISAKIYPQCAKIIAFFANYVIKTYANSSGVTFRIVFLREYGKAGKTKKSNAMNFLNIISSFSSSLQNTMPYLELNVNIFSQKPEKICATWMRRIPFLKNRRFYCAFQL